MGTNTIFDGQFRLDRPLTKEHAEYLHAFNRVRHMQRDPALLATVSDPIREAVGLPVGNEGVYFVNGGRFYREYADDKSVIESNLEPEAMPGLWCQWRPTKDRCGLEWDFGEKFYGWTAWLNFIIEHFLTPWGYAISGSVEWYNGYRSGATIIKNGKAVEIESDTAEDNPWRATRRLSRSGRQIYGSATLFTSDCSKLGKRRLRSRLAHQRKAIRLDPKRTQPLITMRQYYRS